MTSAGLGDPCLPHEAEELAGGNQKAHAMRTLFEVCGADPNIVEQWIKKSDIYDIIRAQSENYPALDWFGLNNDNDRSAKTKTGAALLGYHKRILSGVRLLIDTSVENTQRWRYKFTLLAM